MATHEPVMLTECLDVLAPALEPGSTSVDPPVFVDATLGLGGHTEALLQRLPDVHVIGVDRDPAARELAQKRLAQYSDRLQIVAGEHEHLAQALQDAAPGGRISAILFDLGVSSMQLDEAERGFSYSRDAVLDMRMNPEDPLSAADVLNGYSVSELERVLKQWGEERFARRIANAIVDRRDSDPVTTTGQLADLVRDNIPAAARRTGGNPAKRTFQAIRIEVNRELAGLPVALEAAIEALTVGGRIAVLSYHSLEDRIVKRRFAAGARTNAPDRMPVVPDDARPTLALLTRSARVPSEDEIARNPRAASARLRAAEKLREAA